MTLNPTLIGQIVKGVSKVEVAQVVLDDAGEKVPRSRTPA